LKKKLLKFENQQQLAQPFNYQQMAEFLKNANQQNNFAERLMVFEGTKIKSIEVHEIAVIYTENKTSFIVYKSGN
jgi:DNA-binding LytR/AlgR family response regulator